MELNTQTPHDAFMKGVLADIAKARTFLQSLLPAELTDHLDLETLRHNNNSFIRGDLSEYLSDAVFSVQLKKQGKQQALVSILLEHKSYPDKQIALQLLTYLVEGYRTQANQAVHHHKIPGKKGTTLRLRPIIPFLFCHGSNDWEYQPLPALFDAQYEAFMRYIPTFDIHRTHLAALPESQILDLREAWLRATLLTQKFSHNPRALLRQATAIFQAVAEVRGGNFIELISVYFIRIARIKQTQFERIINDIPPTVKSKFMTLYDSLVEFGMEQGIQKGFEQGISKGREEGREEAQEQTKREVILTGYKNGVTIPVLALMTGYTIEEVKRILEQG